MVSSEEEVDPFAPAKLAWHEEAGTASEGEAGGGGRSATGDDDALGSDESLGGGSESSSDESLAPFDLKDDRSDLKTATAPRHLRQVRAPFFLFLFPSHSLTRTQRGYPGSILGRSWVFSRSAPGQFRSDVKTATALRHP
eukprot:scaffold23750_cov73-Isochrysis_galbana.AAC.2